MGFRAAFIKHEGMLACHSEIVLQALERTVTVGPAFLLHIGVGNGGTMQIWKNVLPEDSVVLGIDEDSRCQELPVPVAIGPVQDRAWLLNTFGSRTFDIVMDSTGAASGAIWPWLKPGGVYVVEHYQHDRVRELMDGMCLDQETWLPFEEIMSITQFPKIAVIEKRNPRVVPYLDIIVGSEAPIVTEESFSERGAKRVTVPKELLEKL